jgi:hypothetical protein
VRNALIVLLAVALVFVGLGALNHSLAFDIDYVAGSLTAVSVLWITVVIGAVLLVAGVVAIWLARTSVVSSQRKLEAELQSTYERLRAAEARVPAEPTPAPEPAPPTEPEASPELDEPSPEPDEPSPEPEEPTTIMPEPEEPFSLWGSAETPPPAPR